MARARNIKPAIMDNEELAEFDPATRLLFIYLWMLADRDGRLEDRPKRIAAQALPYDRQLDVEAMLNDLHKSGFIVRYVVDGLACIQIMAFSKHQTPHLRETASVLPVFEASQEKAVPRQCLGNVEALPRSPDSGFSDSGFSDSLIPERETPPAENSGSSEPNASAAPQPHPAETIELEPIKPKNQVDQKKPEAKAHRLPTGWQPEASTREWAGRERPDLDLDKVLESFRDFWGAKGGKDGRKTDWDATLRNWVRREEKAHDVRAGGFRASFTERDAALRRKKYEEIHGVPHPDNVAHARPYNPALVIDAEVLQLGVGT